jgi:transcriptional regulator with XRE-family HTH domain
MDDYRLALSAYLEPTERTQEALAEQVGCAQATIHRYMKGDRFPDAETARKIDAVTEGEVSFAVWQRVAMARLGIDEAA